MENQTPFCAVFEDAVCDDEFSSPSHSSDSGYLDFLSENLLDAELDLDFDLLDDFCGGEFQSDILSSVGASSLSRDFTGIGNGSRQNAIDEHDYAAACPTSESEEATESNREKPTEHTRLPLKRKSGNIDNILPKKVNHERNELDLLPKNRKNAELARLNRQRKKRYVTGLENELSSFKERNGKLVAQNKKLTKLTNQLQDRVSYLTKVLENESTLSAVLSAVTTVPGLDFQIPRDGVTTRREITETASSARKGLRSAKRGGTNSRLETEKLKLPQSSGGICLHIAKNNVCVEFCEKCASRAAAAK